MELKIGLILKDSEKADSTRVPESDESSVRMFAPLDWEYLSEANEVILYRVAADIFLSWFPAMMQG